MKSTRSCLIAILLVSVLLRVGVALYLGDRVEPVSGAHDQVSYDALAQRVAAGHYWRLVRALPGM